MLLELRSEGYLAGAWNTESPEWPTHVADQFDGDGIPEIRVDELSVSSIRSGIENHGSLIVRGLVTSSQVNMLRDNIDQAIEALDAVESDSVGPENEGWYEPFHRDTISNRATKRLRGSILTSLPTRAIRFA
jgi:hypothetical protein